MTDDRFSFNSYVTVYVMKAKRDDVSSEGVPDTTSQREIFCHPRENHLGKQKSDQKARVRQYTHTHTALAALAPCAPRCALAWGFAAVKGVGNGLLRVRLRVLLRVGNVKGAVCEDVWVGRVRGG